MSDSNCIFCDIYNGKEPATVLYKDAETIIFLDIRPAARHHYLVIPKEHIPNAKHLKKDHIRLVETLFEHGERILREKKADIQDSRIGFHWPPFNSISHLHLHVISPASEMPLRRRIIFLNNNLWFVTPQYVLERLARL